MRSSSRGYFDEVISTVEALSLIVFSSTVYEMLSRVKSLPEFSLNCPRYVLKAVNSTTVGMVVSYRYNFL